MQLENNLSIYIQQIGKILQWANWTVKNHNWFTTYESDYEVLLVNTNCGFPLLVMLVARFMQSAAPTTGFKGKVICYLMHFG